MRKFVLLDAALALDLSQTFFEKINDVNLPVTEKHNTPVQQNYIEIEDEQKASADKICQDFYADLGVSKDEVSNDLVNAGGQGFLFRCSTSKAGVDPIETAQKWYYTTDDKNMTEIAAINIAANKAGVRPTLYTMTERGYIEQWLGDYQDLWTMYPVSMWDVKNQAAALLGKLHSVEAEGLNTHKYKTFEAWWNTERIGYHFMLLETGSISQWTNADKVQRVLDWFGWDFAEYRANILWTQQLILDYHKDEEKPIFCHNDLHAGNMMVKKDDFTGDSLIMIDYDNAAYGHRAFDFAYNLGYTAIFSPDGKFPSEDMINEYLQTYLDNYTGTDKDKLSLAILREELDIHLPYVLLEQQIFQSGIIDSDWLHDKRYFCPYEELQRKYKYPNPIDCNALLDASSSTMYILSTALLVMQIV